MADDVMAALDKVLQTYKAGGEFSQQRASQLKGAERKYTAGAQQGLVSRGLSGTTIAQSIPSAFEQEVGAPYRTETERLRSGQEMQGLLAKAGFLSKADELAMREKLSAASITSREKIASADRASRTRSSTSSSSATSGLGTFASRAAASKARLAARDTGSSQTSASTSSQHVGKTTALDFGIDYGSGGTGGLEGAIPNAPAAPAGADPFAAFAPSMDTLAEGGLMVDRVNQDQEMPMSDLARLAEAWMSNPAYREQQGLGPIN
jgi:hypothetical protein